jgi:hypothetical protein
MDESYMVETARGTAFLTKKGAPELQEKDQVIYRTAAQSSKTEKRSARFQQSLEFVRMATPQDIKEYQGNTFYLRKF